MAPLANALYKEKTAFKTIICVTGQHREMLDQVTSLFDINPDYDLNIMKSGQDLYDITSRVLLGLRDVYAKEKPDLVLVHGDTSTSTTAALAAFYQQIPVGHIEAGLRTFNMNSPWPEEMNRQITGRIASFHFAPTELSKDNLVKENISPESIIITGNTVIDALYEVKNKIKTTPTILDNIKSILVSTGIDLSKLNSWENKKRKLILITGHRRENFGQGFINICKSIKELSEKYSDVDFVYPMHLNPKVRQAIKTVFGSTDGSSNLFFIEPLDYLPFVYMMSNTYIMVTDSGGIQEEAPGLGIPVLVTRDNTERPEALDAGTVMLVGTDKKKIITSFSRLIDDDNEYFKMAKAVNPYGDGTACLKIINALKGILN